MPVNDSVYLSLDTIFDPTDRYLGHDRPALGVWAPGCGNVQGTIQLPPGVAGTYYLIVVANGGAGSIYETNTSDEAGVSAQPLSRSTCPRFGRPGRRDRDDPGQCRRRLEYHPLLSGHQREHELGGRLVVRLGLPLSDPDLDRQRPQLGEVYDPRAENLAPGGRATQGP